MWKRMRDHYHGDERRRLVQFAAVTLLRREESRSHHSDECASHPQASKKTERSFKAKKEIYPEGGVMVCDYTQTGTHRYGQHNGLCQSSGHVSFRQGSALYADRP